MKAAQQVSIASSGALRPRGHIYARALRGRRIHDDVSGGHWKMLTILGAMEPSWHGTHHARGGSYGSRKVLLAYLDEILCPKLRPGRMVILDNLSAHKVDGVRQRIRETR